MPPLYRSTHRIPRTFSRCLEKILRARCPFFFFFCCCCPASSMLSLKFGPPKLAPLTLGPPRLRPLKEGRCPRPNDPTPLAWIWCDELICCDGGCMALRCDAFVTLRCDPAAAATAKKKKQIRQNKQPKISPGC